MKFCTLTSAASILLSAVPGVFSMKVSKVAGARWVGLRFLCQAPAGALIVMIFIHSHLTRKPSIYIEKVARIFLCGRHQVHRGLPRGPRRCVRRRRWRIPPSGRVLELRDDQEHSEEFGYLVLPGPPTMLLEPEEVRA